MKRFIFIITFIIFSIGLKAQYRGLWYEASDYYQLGDSTVAVWGKDTLTNPAMVRAIVNWYFANVKIDSALIADTSMYSLITALAEYADSAGYSDTTGYAFKSDSALYSDTTGYAFDVASLQNIITVAQSGGDYTSIKAAMESITDNTFFNRYKIIVAPGFYVEDNPVQIKKYVGIEGTSLSSTVVRPLNATENLFLADDFTTITNISLSGVIGSDGYLVRMDSVGTMLISNTTLNNSTNGVCVSNPDADVTILNTAFFTTTDPFENGINITAGNITIDFMKLINDSEVDTIINLSGSNTRVSISGLISESPNVGVMVAMFDTVTVTGLGIRGSWANNGFVIDGDSVIARFDGVQLYDMQTDGFRVEATANDAQLNLFATTIIDAGNLNFNILSSSALIAGNGFTDLDKGYIESGARFYAYLLDTKEGDEGLNVFGELHVGGAGNPAESAFGGGDSYTRGMLVYEYNGGTTVYTNVTDSVVVVDGYSAEFPTTGVNSAIYITTTINDTAIHYGIKNTIIDSLTVGAGEVVAEYYNGSSWVEFNCMVTDSDPPFAPRAKSYFEQDNGTHIRYSIAITQDDVMKPIDPMGLGTAHKWIRFRITSAITESCRIDQIKVHPSRLEVNAGGFLENFGNARNSQILELSIGSGNPFEGNMQNQTIFVDEDVAVGYQQNRFTATGDKLGYSINLPDNIDTGCPVNLVWSGRYVTGGAVQWTIRYRRVQPGQTLYTSEPVASGETVVVVIDETATAAINELFSVELDLSEYLPIRVNGFGDQVWVSFQPTILPGSFDISNIGAAYFSWSEGGYFK